MTKAHMWRRSMGGAVLSAAAVLFLAAGAAAQAERAQPAPAAAKAPAEPKPLLVGDRAPELHVEKWVKGDPITGFEKGNVYVVETWATWCGPCKVSIPHLTELQKKHPDVKIIGVSMWESDFSRVEPFVKDMGDKMDYRVAVDEVPDLPESVKAGTREAQKWAYEQGKMSQNWMVAANRNGIPSAFIVDRDGRVAWMGHPMQMDEPLAKVAAGTWDIEAEAEKSRKAAAAEADQAQLEEKINEAAQKGDWGTVATLLDGLIAANPEAAPALAAQKFHTLLVRAKDYDRAYAWGREMLTKYKDEPDALNAISWLTLDEGGVAKRDYDFAIKAAERANEVTGGNRPDVLDTLAKAYFDSGEQAKGLDLQEKAAELAKGTPFEGEINERLEEYRKAMQGGG